jgi:predicted small lipoprotein YifL
MKIVLVVMASLAVVGCGLKGGLEQPPPRHGEARAAYEAQKKAEADAEEKRKQQQAAPAPKS